MYYSQQQFNFAMDSSDASTIIELLVDRRDDLRSGSVSCGIRERDLAEADSIDDLISRIEKSQQPPGKVIDERPAIAGFELPDGSVAHYSL